MHGARIKYVKQGDKGLLRSFKSYNGLYVFLDPAINTFFIIEGNTNNLIYTETIKAGTHKLKIAAKKKLEELGVVFIPEKRKVVSEVSDG